MAKDGTVEEWHGVILEWDESNEDGYRHDSYKGVAFHIIGKEMRATEDTEWDGIYEPTGKIIAHMVGDDRPFVFDREDLLVLEDSEYCGGCGQIGCSW